jgi:hypothetical protein
LPTIKKSYDRVLPALAKQLDRARPEILQLPAPTLSEDADARLRAAREQLVTEGLPTDAIDKRVDVACIGSASQELKWYENTPSR